MFRANVCALLSLPVTLALLGSSRPRLCIRLAAAQGVLVGVLPLAMAGGVPSPRAAAPAAAMIVVKGLLFPWLLRRVLRDVEAQRELEPFLGYTASLFLGVLAFDLAHRIGGRLSPQGAAAGGAAMPAALFAIFAGLIMIVTRRKAVMQVIGYLAMENGICMAGFLLAPGAVLVVELGILLDLLVGVFLMGILVFHINREFNHIDTDKLAALRDA
jgi:hydrogenase-4 component E